MPGKKIILLVEDEALIAMAQKKALEAHGYRVITAHSAEKAIRKVHTTPDIDLILMDINLGTGKMDGTECAEIILKERDVPVLFLSSYTQPEIVERTERITSYGYVVKDSGETVLNTSIKMAFKLHEANRELKEGKEALREGEEKYRTVVEQTHDGIYIYKGNRFAFVNSRIGEITGYSSQELYEMNLWDLLHPDDREYVVEIGRKRASGENAPSTYEARIITKDGRMRHLELAVSAISYEGDYASLGAVRDITDRKQAEEALRESKLQLEMVINASNIGLWDWDVKTNKVYFSPEWKRQIGHEEWEISNDFSEWQNRVHPDDLERAQSKVQTFLKHPYPDFENEFRFRHKDGSYRWILARASVLTDEKGNSLRMLGSHLDITERKRAEEAVEKSKELLDAVGRMAKVGGWEIDTETRKLTWTEEIGHIFEVPERDIPSVEEAIAFFHPDFRDMLREALRRAFDHGQPYDLEIPLITAKGNRIWTRSICIPQVVAGTVVKLAGTFQDITERKRAEEQLKASLREKELLLKEIHHRVKNNLMVVSSIINLQSEKVKDSNTRDLLEDCRKRIQVMSLVHNRLYRSADLSHISFREYLGDLISDIARSHGAHGGGVTLSRDIEEVSFDIDTAIPLGLIVNELVSNALKHAFPGHRKGNVAVTLRKQDESALLTVRDDGAGFPVGLDFARTESLGMQLVVSLTEQIEGTIDMSSHNGTSFTVTFPRGRSHHE